MHQFESLKKSTNWCGKPPAKESDIQRIVEQFGKNLPSEYLSLLRFNNGGEGDISSQPVLFRLWSVDEVIESHEAMQVGEFLPNFMVFGGDGANELFAFKTNIIKSKVFMIPMIVMCEDDAIVIAESFSEFAEQIGKEFIEND